MNHSTPKNLLLADNNSDYLHSLHVLLELENWQVEDAESVKQAMEKLDLYPLDLIIVDLRLKDDEDEHDISGLEVAKKAAERHIPCIIISAFPTVEVTRTALRSRGIAPLAVDFVPKSAGPQALLDAIHIVINNSNDLSEDQPLELRIDLGRKLVWYRGKNVSLSRNQYSLLACLFQKEGGVCSSEELMFIIYGEQVSEVKTSSDRRLEHLVERLQKKIEEDPTNPKHLIKVPRRGFRLVV